MATSFAQKVTCPVPTVNTVVTKKPLQTPNMQKPSNHCFNEPEHSWKHCSPRNKNFAQKLAHWKQLMYTKSTRPRGKHLKPQHSTDEGHTMTIFYSILVLFIGLMGSTVSLMAVGTISTLLELNTTVSQFIFFTALGGIILGYISYILFFNGYVAPI